MPNDIHLEPSQVPAHLRGAYTGRKFKVQIAERVTVPADAGLWSGGSRDVYTFVRLSDGASVKAPGQDGAPWDGRSARAYDLPEGIAAVRATVFQGRDLGLTFYVRPDAVAALIPSGEAPDLSREAQIVLRLAGEYVASYRRGAAEQQGIERKQYDRILDQLATAGLLKANGAITVQGRNVLATLPRIAGL